MPPRRFLSLATVLLLAAGCSNRPGPGPLLPDYHYQSSPRGTDESRHVLVDQPEKLYDSVSYDLMRPGGIELIPQETKSPNSVTAVSPTASDEAHQQMEHVASAPASGPTTPPGTRPGTLDRIVTKGTSNTIGGVVVQVNERPIYAEQVIEPLRAMLAAEAKRYDVDGFRVIAGKAVNDQVMSMIRNELLVAQAEQVLDKSEKDYAWQMTMFWQQQQIAAAGGSLEQAKARASAEGNTFERMLQDNFRENKVKIYYQKKLFPRLQVTAQDVRDYYQRHLKDAFSEPEQIQFRLIKISVKAAGRDDAMKKITDLHDRVSKGEDFQTLASQFNDDTRLAKNGGLEQLIARGAYVNEKVELAVWKIQPDQLTEIIETPNAFYMAKVVTRKEGHVRPFEDPAVQAQITETLRKEQFGPLIEAEQKKLINAHPIFPDPPRFELAVDLAMQMYPQWAAR